MKQIAAAVMAFFLASGVALAAPPSGEEIEFRFEPSFREGISVWLARTPEGKIYCSAYRLPLVADGGIPSHSKAPPKLLKRVSIGAKDFDGLVAALEGRELRAAAESDSLGLDGTAWIFRRRAGGLRLELQFWTPELDPDSPALALGRRFLALAQIENEMPKDERDRPAQPTPEKAPRANLKP